jgi:hypothetical protein
MHPRLPRSTAAVPTESRKAPATSREYSDSSITSEAFVLVVAGLIIWRAGLRR